MFGSFFFGRCFSELCLRLGLWLGKGLSVGGGVRSSVSFLYLLGVGFLVFVVLGLVYIVVEYL